MIGKAKANGAGTIVNAIAGNKGIAYATTLQTTATVELSQDKTEITGDAGKTDPELIEKTVEKTLEHYDRKNLGGTVETGSNIPVAMGLKSSSAASNAAALATTSALGKKRDNQRILEIAIEASKEAGVTITGAMDDQSASLLGGITITDNKRNKLIERRERNQLALILLPSEQKQPTKEVDPSKPRLLKKEVQEIHKIARNGQIYKAMNLNGLVYTTALGHSAEIIFEALENGAKAASLSGTGPAYTALTDSKQKEDIKRAWNQHGKVIETKINNQGAKTLCP